MTLKTSLERSARLMRGLAWGLERWPWLVIIACVISPISPHVRLPYEAVYSDCAYIGTRGLVEPTAQHCPPLAIINTSDAEIVQW